MTSLTTPRLEPPYSSAQKQQAYRRAAKAFRALAAELGIPPSRYDIRPCYGGPAISGEAIFHSDTLYISFTLFDGNGPSYFRACNGRKDYVGKQNHMIQRFPTAAMIRRCLGPDWQP